MLQIQINSLVRRPTIHDRSVRPGITPSTLRPSDFHQTDQTKSIVSACKATAIIVSAAEHHANHEHDTIDPVLNTSDPNFEQGR